MNHLTTAQVLQAADGTADFATQAMVSNHVAVCSICRRELEFQKGLLQVARRIPPASASDGFTGRVMSRIIPRKQGPVVRWVMNNMGNVFGMMVVLGVVWYVAGNPQTFISSSQVSEKPSIYKQWKEGMEGSYGALKSLFERPNQPPKAIVEASPNHRESTLVMVFISILVLIVGDSILLRRNLPFKK